MSKIGTKSQIGYFTIEAVPEIKLGSTQRIWFTQYTLLSVAKLDNYAIDVYRTYFNSAYSKEYQRQSAISPIINIEQRHVSEFFIIFLHIYILRSLIGGHQSLQGVAKTVINDLIDIKQEKQALLLLFVKAEVNHLYEGVYKKLFKNKLGIEDCLQSVKAVEKQIKSVLEPFYTRIEDKAQFKLIKERQLLPQNMNNGQLVRYIKENFRAICNIKMMRKSQIRQALKQWLKTLRHHMSVKIPYIMQTNKGLKDLNKILLGSNIFSENQPVLQTLQSYIENYLFGNEGKETKTIWLAQINLLVLLSCINFHDQTKRVYPGFSINAIIFDHKKLQPIINHDSLLLDSLGLVGQTKHFQLRLATEPTPRVFDPEQSYLESIEQNELKLQRKYYYFLKDRDEQSQTIIEQLKLMEQIHVERLIKIFYFIQNGRHLIQDYRGGKFHSKGLEKNRQQTSPILHQQDYISIINSIHWQLKEGNLQISSILNNTKGKEASVGQKFQYSMNYLGDYFDIKDKEDSLFQETKLHKIRSYLNDRHLILSQINSILQKGFKGLINSKKHLIFCLINMLENLYFMKEFQLAQRVSPQNLFRSRFSQQIVQSSIREYRSQATKAYFTHKMLVYLFHLKINNASLYEIFQDRDKICKNSLLKIEEYKTRSDKNNEYLYKNPQFANKIGEIFNHYLLIIDKYKPALTSLKNDKSLITKDILQKKLQVFFQENYKESKTANEIRQLIKSVKKSQNSSENNQIDKQSISKLKEKIQDIISERINQSIKSIGCLLVKFFKTQIKTKHKFQSERGQKICQYYNYLLSLLVKCLLIAGKDNFTRLSLIYKRVVSQNQNKLIDNLPIEVIERMLVIIQPLLGYLTDNKKVS